MLSGESQARKKAGEPPSGKDSIRFIHTHKHTHTREIYVVPWSEIPIVPATPHYLPCGRIHIKGSDLRSFLDNQQQGSYHGL